LSDIQHSPFDIRHSQAMILLDPDAHPVIGHRGASGEYPENTIVAFDAAIAQGADALEFDVRLSVDGVAMVIHDPTVDRTTNGSGAVGSMTADRLGELDAGGGASIPRLDEVLDRYREVPCIIEIKEAPAAVPVASALARHDAARRVLVGSFEHAALRPFGAPPFARSASRRETLGCWVLSRVSLPWPGAAVRAFTVPERHGGVTVVDRAFVHSALRRRRPVHVWTVNDVESTRRLRAIGVSGIITNHPAAMKAVP
jgi:glycerophosphoryl diester phosphodiesterase